MAEFTLPKNSKVKAKGKVHKATGDAKRIKTFKVYRYDPDTGENPRYDTISRRRNSFALTVSCTAVGRLLSNSGLDPA